MFLLKISLFISLLSLMFFALTLLRGFSLFKKSKYKDLKGDGKQSKFLLLVRIIIVSLIPLINILFLAIYSYAFLFAQDDWYDKNIFSKLEKDQIKE